VRLILADWGSAKRYDGFGISGVPGSAFGEVAELWGGYAPEALLSLYPRHEPGGYKYDENPTI